MAKCRTYVNRKDALNKNTSNEEEERKTKNTHEKKSGGRIGIGNEIERRIPSSRRKTYVHVSRIYIARGVSQYSLVLFQFIAISYLLLFT